MISICPKRYVLSKTWYRGTRRYHDFRSWNIIAPHYMVVTAVAIEVVFMKRALDY